MSSCEHEWERPYAHLRSSTAFRILRCKKCGLEAMEYYCETCDKFTPHVYAGLKGSAKTRNFEKGFGVAGDLEIYKCLICGSTKTVRRNGYYSRNYR
jgi:hypothetical protein